MLARRFFKFRVGECDGQAFEDLFTRIMTYADPEFQAVKPQGSFGDRKNDGFNRRLGRYYQVYSPQEPQESSAAAEACRKARRDFEGLKRNWDGLYKIREYFFVFNDKYRGVYPTIYQELSAIEKEHGLDDAGPFVAKDLEAILFRLPEDVILTVIGPIPSANSVARVSFGPLGEVIRHILEHRLPFCPDGRLTAPDFEEKLRHNKLSRVVSTMLMNFSHQVGLVDDFFSRNSADQKQELRDVLNQHYKEAAEKHVGDDGAVDTDQVFVELLDFSTPPADRLSDRSHLQDAAAVVLAYFFEACDIFEDPSLGTTHAGVTNGGWP